MNLKQINQSIRIGWHAVILIVILAVTCSCGVRKTNNSKTNEQTNVDIEVKEATTETEKVNTDINIKKETKTETNIETGEVIETETIKPENPNLPASYTDEKGNKKELNNATYTKTKKTKNKSEKKKDESKVDLSKNEAKIKDKKANKDTKASIDSKKQTKNKQTEKTYSWWNLLWFLLIIPIYYFYRKYLVGRIF